MVVLVWLEENDVERLKDMACMRRQAVELDLIELAVVDEVLRRMRAVPVADQKALCAFTALSTMELKVLDPGQRDIVIRIPRIGNSNCNVVVKAILEPCS